MAKCNSQGIPYSGRKGSDSYYRSIHGLIVRICSNAIPKGRKPSEKQRLIQMAWANLVILWRLFQKMLSPTFMDRREGETEPNAFVRDNWKAGSVFLTRDMVMNGACVIPPVKINVGTLEPSVNYWKDTADNWVVSDILIGNLNIDENTTVGEFSEAVIALNGKLFCDCHLDLESPSINKESWIDFFVCHQSIDINTNYPKGSIEGRHLLIDKQSTAKLWDTCGGSEGFQNFKGHLATPYAPMNLYTWIRMVRDKNDKYHGTTQALLGDNQTLLEQYSNEQAFLDACESYGGFSQKFLIPFKAKISPYHYVLPTETTEQGKNPAGSGSQGGGSGSAPTQVELTFAVNNSALGTVTPESGLYTVGSTIQAVATAKSGAEFTGWSDGVNTATRSITVSTAVTSYTANFRASGGLGVWLEQHPDATPEEIAEEMKRLKEEGEL